MYIHTMRSGCLSSSIPVGPVFAYSTCDSYSFLRMGAEDVEGERGREREREVVGRKVKGGVEGCAVFGGF